MGLVHGTLTGYTNYRCRCDDCTAATREYQRQRRRLKGVPERKTVERGHGTTSEYFTHGCRCEDCRSAVRSYYRELRGYGPRRQAQHGTASGYVHLKCRCEDCAAAHREYTRQWSRDNADHKREYMRQWYRDNADRNNERRRGSMRVKNDQARYRAAKRSQTVGDVSAAQLQARWDYYGGKCWMCGADAAHMDHVKPIAKGGAHAPCNLRPACAPCNQRKNDDWAGPYRQLRLW